jgi:CRISPR-associated endoribonuclease Cas6
MRFSGNIYLKGKEQYKIPTNYRRSISSLIKEAINKGDNTGKLYENYFGDRKKNKTKPYTFSVYIPLPQSVEEQGKNYLLTESNKLSFHFSSIDYELSTAVYNGLLQISKDNYKAQKGKSNEFKLFNYSVSIRDFYLKLDEQIQTTKALFKILSPIVVRRLENRKGKGYVTFMDKDFTKMLYYSVRNSAQNFISPEYKLEESEFKVNLKDPEKVGVYHYTEVIPATTGLIEIEAPMNILQLLYDVGIGARRNQGFGMLDLWEVN